MIATTDKIKKDLKKGKDKKQIVSEIDISLIIKVNELILRKPNLYLQNTNFLRNLVDCVQKLRKTKEYKSWREKVFERDNYTCQFCGQKGGKLNADHIKPFAYFPELRFDVDNGRTLCKECHKLTDTYGWRAKQHKTTW